LVHVLNIPSQLHNHLKDTVNVFIHNFQWRIPTKLQAIFPSLMQHINTVVIPSSGSLSLKDAFQFISPTGIQRNCAKLIWNPAIPPSKSFLIWRAIHKKLPTYDNLALRGCCLPSMCCSCNMNLETAYHHLLLHCPFSISIWNWLENITNINIDLSFILTVLDVCIKSWSPWVKLTISAAVINIINVIWYTRNNFKFNKCQTKPHCCS